MASFFVYCVSQTNYKIIIFVSKLLNIFYLDFLTNIFCLDTLLLQGAKMEKALEKNKVTLEINKNTLKKLGTYILFVPLFYILCSASINLGYICTFGFGVYFGLLWGKFDPLYTTISYFVGASLSSFSIAGVSSALICSIVGMLYCYIFLRKNRRKWICLLMSLLSQSLYVYFLAVDVVSLLVALLGVGLGGVVTMCTINVVSSTVLHNFTKKLVIDEKVCLGVIIAILGMGLASKIIWLIEPIKIFFLLSILILGDIGYNKQILYMSICLGLGATLYTMDPSYTSAFAIIGLLCQIFVETNRYFVALSTILLDIMLGLFLNCFLFYNILSIIFLCITALIYWCIPKRIIMNVKKYIPTMSTQKATRNIVVRTQETLSNKMKDLSNIFLEMERAYRNMTKGMLSEKDIKEDIGRDIMDKCCKNCSERNKCLRINGKYTDEVFHDMLDAGMKKGKINLIDVSQYLSTKCVKLNNLISCANNLLAGYKNYATVCNNMDSSRLLVADQLCGVSNILQGLAKDVKNNITYDTTKENRLLEEIGYLNICVDDVAVYQDNVNILCASISIKGTLDNQQLKELNKIVNKVCGCKMLKCDNNDDVNDINIYTYKTMPNYTIAYGCANCTKNKVVASGDTHSLIKIDDGKYMMAICDGMGSGQKARDTSTLAISLIENFYKAGFDNEMILSSVNKLLSLSCDENFSALDICVVDGRKNTLDFIKLGAPYGIIKNNTQVEVIDTSGLPIGVLDEMHPHITKRVIQDGDMIIELSDGVCDVYNDVQDLLEYVRSIDAINPQTVAENILQHTIDKCSHQIKDDMSVCVLRLVAN